MIGIFMRDLMNMSKEELWELFPIVLTEYNPDWQLWASEEIARLYRIMTPIDCTLHHIGSTAINGIWAKPIIDIILAVNDISCFATVKSLLQRAGYICMSQSINRMSFNKGYTPEGFAENVYHVHVRIKGDVDEIYFRDYLIAHLEIAKEYELLKLSLWKKFEHDRDGYTQAKTDFIVHYTQCAKCNFESRT